MHIVLVSKEWLLGPESDGIAAWVIMVGISHDDWDFVIEPMNSYFTFRKEEDMLAFKLKYNV